VLPLFAAATVLTTLLVIIIISFWSGFDFTDEGFYLYFYSHPDLPGFLPIDNIAGQIGTLFGNNIIIWRLTGLTLLISCSLLFGLSLLNFLQFTKPEMVVQSDSLKISLFAIAGALYYYTLGPPTLPG
jgi:hypothetical protein